MLSDSNYPDPSRFSLAPLGTDEKFRFKCDASQPCFNRCCSNAIIPLTPYDVLRLRRNLELDSEIFLQNLTSMNIMPESSLALPLLRMVKGPDTLCPFTGPAGCSVYEDRPGTCRTYPVEKAARLDDYDENFNLFLLKQDCCQGFTACEEWTAQQWLEKEGMGKYNKFNSQFAALAARMSSNPQRERLGKLCFLCLYQLDRFREFIEKMKLFTHVPVDVHSKSLIMDNSLGGDEACLDFAFRWLELAVPGTSKI